MAAGYGRRRKNRQRRLAAALAIGVLCAGTVAASVYFLGKNLVQAGGAPLDLVAMQPGHSGPYRIAIDAGHGGDSLGGQGFIDEVQLTEGTARALMQLLENDPNYSPFLCREYGMGATLAERAEVANSQNADLLLSIHGNYDDMYGSSGFECYPKPPGREKHSESLVFANMLAQEMKLAGSTIRGENGVRYMYFKDVDGVDERIIHEASDTSVYDHPSFGMVEAPNCPAVLVEQCFVTNQQDVQAFGTEAGFEKAAQCYYNAICQYFGTQPVT